MLCDTHIHYIPEVVSAHTTFYKGVWSDKSKLYEFLEKHSITRAFVVYPSTDACLKLGALAKECKLYNTALEEILQENKKIIAAGIVDINNKPAHIFSQIEELKNKGFSAISLASSYDGRFDISKLMPVFEAAEKFGLAIFVHPQTVNPIGFERVKDPLLTPVLEYSLDISMFLGLLMMENVLERFNIRFIFSSLGGVTPFIKNRFDRVYTMLRERGIVKDLGGLPSQIMSKVYVDTSGASLKDIELALELFGEDKILWGSDYPVCSDIEINLRILDKLGKETKEKIVCKNFLGVFKDENTRG